jgi:hypothetical protein
MVTVYSTRSCAIGELDGISTVNGPEDILKSIAPAIRLGVRDQIGNPHQVPFLTFSGVVERACRDHASGRLDNYGQAFADYILDNQLGSVVASVAGRNWTGNLIQVWVWTVNYDNLIPLINRLAPRE